MGVYHLSLFNLVLALLSTLAKSAQISYPPTWVSSNYIRAGNQDLFTTLTGSGIVHSFTFTFSSNLSGIPHLGYGIKAYQGNDYFGQERFEVNKIALTQASFTVTVQTIGATNLYLLNVPYIAIDPLFPHHVNSFDNVPVNYSAGPLVNVSVKNYVNTQYYWNIINYTQQAASTNHRYFSEPYQKNKVLLFMTCMYITGNNQPQFAPPENFNPLNLHIYTQVLSNETYLLNVSLSIKINLERLQYSMVVFDQEDVENSLKYYLVAERIDLTDEGGFIPAPAQFVDNFIMGFTDFSSYRTLVAIHFSWDFTTVNGTHGVFMPKSIGRSPVGTVITRVGYTIFYMKTWVCPTNTFINHTTNLCTACAIEGCLTCLSLKVCGVCDNTNHYKLQGNKCVRCDVDNNYFLNPDTMQCELCPIQFCPHPKVQKQLCNSMVISVYVTKQLPVSCQMSQIYTVTDGIKIKSAQLSKDGKVVKIYADYFRDMKPNQQLTVYLGPRDRRVIFCDPSVPQMLYAPQQCQIENLITKMLQGAQILSYVLLFISLISCKIVGLELFGVLQLAYFALGSYSYLDIYIAPLSIFKSTNGFNLQTIFRSSQTLKILDYLGIQNTFINNFNVMFLLLIMVILIGSIFYVITRLTLNKIFQERVLKFFKQGTITLVMFNIYNIGYSTGVHIKYGGWNIGSTDYTISTVVMSFALLICVVVMVAFQFVDPAQYGEFKNKFKSTWICLVYIPLSLLYRLAIVLYLSLQIEYQQSTLIILAAGLFFNMYFIINLPFVDWFQNYRAGLCHVTQLVILLTSNYYRSMKSNTPMQIKYRLHTFAIVELMLILLCVILSAVVLAVEVVKFVKELCQSKARQVADSRTNTEASMVQFQAQLPSYLKN